MLVKKKASEYFKGKDIDFNLNLTLEDIKYSIWILLLIQWKNKYSKTDNF